MIQANHTALLHKYLQAKDESRPYLFRQVFPENGRFQTRFSIDTDFDQGGMREGIAEITNTFGMLGRFFENIFTTCPIESASYTEEGQLQSTWIVGMSSRDNGDIRIAAGAYLWTFDEESGKVAELDVLMEHMLEFPGKHLAAIMDWLSALPQPWCETKALLDGMPEIEGLEPVRTYFSK